jgi:hypothetical protein
MPSERDWRGEAVAHGLTLSDDDLTFIRDQVERVKAALAAQRPGVTEGLEPPYRFAPPLSPPRRRRSRRG